MRKYWINLRKQGVNELNSGSNHCRDPVHLGYLHTVPPDGVNARQNLHRARRLLDVHAGCLVYHLEMAEVFHNNDEVRSAGFDLGKIHLRNADCRILYQLVIKTHLGFEHSQVHALGSIFFE